MLAYCHTPELGAPLSFLQNLPASPTVSLFAGAHAITNYDGGIVTTPQQHVHPKTVEELQAILRDRHAYPGPVRAMGSNHSLTPCASSSGTIVSMDGFNRILKIDTARKTSRRRPACSWSMPLPSCARRNCSSC